MRSFKRYINEVWLNEIDKGSKEKSVVDKTKYNQPTEFKKNATKVGEVGGLHLYRSENSHFTWNPEDRMIHHVVHAVESSSPREGVTRLKYLSAHSRENSHVRMGEVYSRMVKNHNYEFVATGHSPGAKKMWDRFKNDDNLKLSYEDDGSEVKKTDNVYAPHKTKDPAEKSIGRRAIVLSRREEE